LRIASTAASEVGWPVTALRDLHHLLGHGDRFVANAEEAKDRGGELGKGQRDRDRIHQATPFV
jgi:hypothetical protein